jgi:hypothetical protein
MMFKIDTSDKCPISEELDTTLCDKVGLWLSGGRWFSTNKTDRHHIAEILLKVALSLIIMNP